MNRMKSSVRVTDSCTGGKDLDSATYLRIHRKLTYIPLIFIIGRIWGTLRFILALVDLEQVAMYISPLQVGNVFFCFMVCLLW